MQVSPQHTSSSFKDIATNVLTDVNKTSEPKTKTVIDIDVAETNKTAEEEQNDQEIKNHFTEIPKDFLEDITEIFEEFNITDLESAFAFDLDILSSKLVARGRMADLVKDLITQWKNALKEAMEQQKRIEEEIERKKRTRRPVWKCRVCGRPSNPGCPVAPYIAYYIDVEA